MTAINEALMTAQELTQLDEREAHERAEAKARELLRRVRDSRAVRGNRGGACRGGTVSNADAIISALATLARGSHDVDGLDDAQRDIWRELAVEARREYDGLRARVAELEQRAEKAEANYRFMVERAADEKLDGYRELGQRAAAAEQRAERAEAEVAELRLELDAAQEHIHAGDECITSLHDDLARVADIVREWSDVGASYEAMRAIQKAVKAYVHAAEARRGGKDGGAVSNADEQNAAEAASWDHVTAALFEAIEAET